MCCYHHLSREEREYIHVYHEQGHSLTYIAKCLKRSVCTISRELKRNASPDCSYSAFHAQDLAEKRKHIPRRTPFFSSLEHRKTAHFFIAQLGWSPEEIYHRLKLEGIPFASTSTIYRALQSKRLRDTLIFYLRIMKKRIGKAKKPKRKCFSRSIEERQQEAEQRTRIGDLEGDTVHGYCERSAVVSILDRKSRYLKAGKVENKGSSEVRKMVVKLIKAEGIEVKTMTFDQGMEFSESKEMEEELGAQVYYAHVHSPWERGRNENTNGLIRQYIPKRRSLAEYTEEDIRRIAALINLGPRKCLGWKTPYEVFHNASLHFY